MGVSYIVTQGFGSFGAIKYIPTLGFYTGTPVAGGDIKVYDGMAFSPFPVKVWDGGSWVTKPLKYFDGAVWVTTSY